ncbi:MAG: aspartyl-tRNA(Asn)/glutamyl-tRNA(Gln) amidotransferase subunit A [Bacteroidia bacterium]
MNAKTLRDYQSEIASGSTSCVALVKHFLTEIDANKHLNAFLEVFAEEALQRAELVDAKISNSTAGALAGLVIGLKDNISYEGHAVTGSSQILKGYTSTYNATVTQRLLDADAIIIGRLNCDEFAMGASNENSSYGPVLNAADNSRVPGGSSGGSAVSVQAGLCMAALGSDTGGSIRQPASFTGTFGIKPTYGRVSRWGLLAYASSFDQIGPITTNVEDMARILEVIAGPDEYDATAYNEPVGSYKLDDTTEPKPKKIAYIKDCLNSDGITDDVKAHTGYAIESLRKEGHTVEGVDFPYLDFMVPCYYVLTTAEASSNLSRYSGLVYGHRSTKADTLTSTFKLSRSEGFGPEVKRRIMTGTFVLSSDHYDAYYTKAQKVRRVIQQETLKILSEYDFIILPTTPDVAFKIGEKSNDPIAMYLADIFTVQAPLAGIPAISIPTGKSNENLPFGLQIMANMYKEADLLQFSDYTYKLLTKNNS